MDGQVQADTETHVKTNVNGQATLNIDEIVKTDPQVQADGKVSSICCTPSPFKMSTKSTDDTDPRVQIEENDSYSCKSPTPPGFNMSTQECDDLFKMAIKEGELNKMCVEALDEAEKILDNQSNVASASKNSNTIAIESDVCQKCGLTQKSCPEVLYGTHCIHAVLDCYEEVGIHDLTDKHVDDAFLKTYLTLHRHEILKKTNIYNLRTKEEVLPKCLVEGSLKYVKDMLKSRKSFVHVYSSRKYDNKNEKLSKIDQNDEF